MRLRFALATTAVLLTAGSASAQVVRGVVMEEIGQKPVSGAMVLLIDHDDRIVAKVLTGAAGGFSFDSDNPGRFRLRVERIGFETVVSDPFDVPVTGTFQTVAVRVRAVEIPGLDVEGAPRCEVRPEEGKATARVWEEVRKALQAAAWTLDSQIYMYTLMRVERELDSKGKQIVREARYFNRSRAPFVSQPADVLVERGFVRADSVGTVYFAPDAEALLSDPFLDTHCMGLRQGERGLIGLTFEPVRDRRVPDIAGTIWLDAATATLRRLEFRYVNLIDDSTLGDPGGWVAFAHLPDGTWIVREWAIRMPVLDIDGPFQRRVRRVAYRDDAGVVWRVVDRSGSVVMEATTGTVGGSVMDSTGASPLAGTRLRSLVSGETTTSAADGGFLLTGLPPGPTMVALTHPSLDSLGLSAPPVTVDAPMGQFVTVRSRFPGVLEALSWTCGGEQRPEGTAVVVGLVRSGDGSTPEGARVRIRWRDPRPFAPSAWAEPKVPGEDERATWSVTPEDDARVLETVLAHGGTFVLCDVPVRSDLYMEVEGPNGGEWKRAVWVEAGSPVTLIRVKLESRR